MGAKLNDVSENEEKLPENETAAEAQTAVATVIMDPRRRLRELLAIPERDRTDAEWDEINELEIQLAPGNRVGNPPHFALAGKTAGAGKNRFRKGRKGAKAKASKASRAG
ncbi:MAG: hypothetical protein N2441_09860 [Rhodocyclaceae bacterium]|nr:hypothetical protein [Rhodocyclaceae bacterium]